MLAIIGGDPRRFAPYVDLYHRALEQFGTTRAPIGVHSPGHIADTDEQARERLWPHVQGDARPHRRRARLAADEPRGVRAATDQHGSLYVGSPETVAQKIAGDRARARRRALRPQVQRGHAPAREDDASIELYGTESSRACASCLPRLEHDGRPIEKFRRYSRRLHGIFTREQ